jgi:hypothetical protein
MTKNVLILPNPFFHFRNVKFNNLSKFSQPHSMYFTKKFNPSLQVFKRTNILFHHSINKLHNEFSTMVQLKFIYKNKKFQYHFFNFLSKHSYTVLIIFSAIFFPYVIYQNYSQEINNQSDLLIKNLIINKVCKNEFIIDKISWEILQLCKRESIKIMLSNLIINDVLPNKEIRNDLYRIIKRELINYIRSEDCRKELKNLIIKEVLRNEEIKNELYSIIKQFITLKEINFLEDKLEKILVDVLSIQAIRTHVAKKIEDEVQKALREENLIRMAINILVEKFK